MSWNSVDLVVVVLPGRTESAGADEVEAVGAAGVNGCPACDTKGSGPADIDGGPGGGRSAGWSS
jgi:hypothetical protein